MNPSAVQQPDTGARTAASTASSSQGLHQPESSQPARGRHEQVTRVARLQNKTPNEQILNSNKRYVGNSVFKTPINLNMDKERQAYLHGHF